MRAPRARLYPLWDIGSPIPRKARRFAFNGGEIVIFSRNQRLSRFDTSARLALTAHLRHHSLSVGDIVLEEDQEPRRVYFPVSGMLSCLKLMRDGRVIEVAALGYSDAAGVGPCLSACASRIQVVCQIGGEALSLPGPLLRETAFANPHLLAVLLGSAESMAGQAEQNAACNALHDTQRRLARWLLQTEDRVGSASFALTQDYMAVMAGAQRTTINASAMQFKAMGLVAYSRGKVRIVDRPGLRALACECYAEPADEQPAALIAS